MSDDESEGEVPVCGSFEPQVWRKGYCRNCFHPGNKHQSFNLLIEDDKRKYGKENIPKKVDKSSKDHSAEKGKPLKPAGQESAKSPSNKKSEKMLDKEKTSFKDRYEQLQKDKTKQEETLSTRKTGSEKAGEKLSVSEKNDSSKNIPPPVLPKTKGLDKLKSKSTSDIREEIKSPIGDKAFKPFAQKDSLDKSKSKFGSAENVSLPGKKLNDHSKQKSGSAENLFLDKSEKIKKEDRFLDKTESPSGDKAKPDYRSLLSSRSSKTDDKTKDKSSRDDVEGVSDKKTNTANRSDNLLSKIDIRERDTSRKDAAPMLHDSLKSTIPSDISQSLEKEKPDFKTKFEKPELKSSKVDDKKDVKDKYEKPDLKSVQEKEAKDLKTKFDKSELTAAKEKETKDNKSKYEKPELKSVQEKETKDFKGKYEKPELKTVEEKEKKDFRAKSDKQDLKTVEQIEKKDSKAKFDKPELKTVEEKEKKDFRTKYEKPDLKVVEEKEKKDYRTKYEKPELKTVDEKEKKDYRAKFEKPELKSARKDDRKADEKDEIKVKANIGDKILSKKTSEDTKSRIKDDDKDNSISIKAKWKLKGGEEEKSKTKTDGQKNDMKAKFDLKSHKTEEKVKFTVKGKEELRNERDKMKDTPFKKDLKEKQEGPPLKHITGVDKGDKTKQDKDKSPASKWLSSLEKDKNKENKSDEHKTKYEKPQLKSIKGDEKAKIKEDQSKVGAIDLKTKARNEEKVDFRKALQDNKRIKTAVEPEKETPVTKLKLDRPTLKSTKTDEPPKQDFKTKFEKPQLKSAKSDEAKDDQKSSLKGTVIEPSMRGEEKDKEKYDKSDKQRDSLNDKDSKLKDREVLDNELNQRTEIESARDKAILDVERGLALEETDSLTQNSQVTEQNTASDTTYVNSVSVANHSQHFDNISSDAKADFDEPDNACASLSARSASPVHVDTQVFTSSRNKTAGVDSREGDLLITPTQKGLSGSQFSARRTESPSRENSEEQESKKNGAISEFKDQTSTEEKVQEERIKLGIENDVEKLKQELLKMAEKCQQLEEENRSLKHGLSAKEFDHTELEKQKHEVEVLILGLQEQLTSMEDRCVRMESENSNLMSKLRKQEESSKHQPATEETQEIQENIQYSESMVEELIEENENLKQEIQDLKVEMEEMYDSFRDQEAEEFRELQKELEITAKNCRILQFKMRKAERRNEQLEDDRNQFEDKLRILQNQFENKDAVAHIKTLEQELKVRMDFFFYFHSYFLSFFFALLSIH